MKRRKLLLLGLPLLLIVAAGIAAGLWYGRPEVLVAFDEAFAAFRPDLVAAIQRPALSANRLSYLELPIQGGSSKLVELLAARKKAPAALALSPLLARALIEGAARNQSAPPGPILAVEGEGLVGIVGVGALVSDPLPAWKEAGRLLGGIVADYRRGSAWSGDPAPAATGALVYAQGQDRSPAAQAAFVEGWQEKAHIAPVVEEILDGEGALEAESRTRGLLAGDLKAILVASGASSVGSLALSMDPGRVSGIATTSLRAAAIAWPLADFALHPDDEALAEALGSFVPSSPATRLVVPWRLSILPGAKELASRDLDLQKRLEGADK